MLTKFAAVPLSELAQRGLVPDPIPPPLLLVVDDEPMIADTLAVILQKAGFAATAAYDAAAALEIAEVTPPDLLLSDVMMPGMNGIELAIEIEKTVPDCKILLISGQASTTDLLAKAGHAAEQFKILAKPIHPRDLLAELAKLGVVPDSAAAHNVLKWPPSAETTDGAESLGFRNRPGTLKRFP